MRKTIFLPVRLTAVLFTTLLPLMPAAQAQEDKAKAKKLEEQGYHEFNYGQENKDAKFWIQAIQVSEPKLRSDVKGNVTVKFKAPGMKSANAFIWQQPTKEKPGKWGHDVNVTPGGISLIGGRGEFTFNADEFPNGPMNVRIFAKNDDGMKDIFELQLFNTGGVKWNQGAGNHIPPIVKEKGLKLVFEDDFETSPPSISSDGQGTTYMAHKPQGGDFSGWKFSYLEDGRPFEQRGTWLRIKARKDKDSPKGRSGIIASVDHEGAGVWARVPCYFECRFTAQSAIGTWPAFWTLTSWEKGKEAGSDEYDIVEAYGGMGKGNPNHPGYSLVSHFWRQKNPDGSKKKSYSARPDIMNLGGKSYWSTTFHTYALYIGPEETIYYFDDIEVKRHPTNDLAKEVPHFFLANLAIAGISGWKDDLRRYDLGSDMWIDYIRVFAKEKIDYKVPNEMNDPTKGHRGIALNFAVQGNEKTMMVVDGVAGAPKARQMNWNNLVGGSGTLTGVKNEAGQPVNGLSVTWHLPEGNSDAASGTGEHWGFKGNYHRLQRGMLKEGGVLKVTGIPYDKYKVYAFTNAGVHGGKGKVSISSPDGGVDPNSEYFYEVGWAEGKLKLSKAKSEKAAKNVNLVEFTNNTAKEFTLEWEKTSGHWTGVTGVQIVEIK